MQHLKGNNRFPGSRTALYNNCLLLIQALQLLQDRLIGNVLLIHQNKLVIAPVQAVHALHQFARRTDSAVFDFVKDVHAFAAADIPVDAFLQLIIIIFEKNRRAVQHIPVSVIQQRFRIPGYIIMQIGTWETGNSVLIDAFVHILHHPVIRVCLIGWMVDIAESAADKGPHQIMDVGCLCTFPLFQFNQHIILIVFLVLTGHDKIDAVAGVRNHIFNQNAAVVCNIRMPHCRLHVSEGIAPGTFFVRRFPVSELLQKVFFNFRINQVHIDITAELCRCPVVDYHLYHQL